MATTPLVQTWQGQVAIAKESSWGAYAAPSTVAQFIKHKQVKVEDIINDEPDESYQGVRSKTQGFYQGFRYSKATIDFYVDATYSGQFFMAFFGKDTVTGTNPYTHTFAEQDAVPPSYTISNYDATLTNTRAITGAFLQKLSISYAEKGLVMGQAIFLGKYVDISHAKPSATYDTVNLYVPWNNALTLNGTSDQTLVGLKLDMDVDVTPVFGASNSQDVTAFSVGTMAITGEATFAPPPGTTTFTEYDLYRGNTQGAFSTIFTNITSTYSLKFLMTKCAFTNGTVIDQGSAYAKVVAKLEGVRNGTDAGPGQIILVNATSGAY